ncbi:MAG: c-type cytochrome [Burkholderiaceae bacterium]
MTRQSRARWLAFATTVLVVLLAAVFAMVRNFYPARVAAPTSPASPVGGTAQQQLDAGRAAFQRMGCVVCHSAERRGNPSLPLDGVGDRRSRDELRAAAFGQGAFAATYPGSVVRIKQARVGDPDTEGVLDYLQQLR